MDPNDYDPWPTFEILGNAVCFGLSQGGGAVMAVVGGRVFGPVGVARGYEFGTNVVSPVTKIICTAKAMEDLESDELSENSTT